MTVDISQVAASLGGAGSIAGGIWAVGKGLVGDLTGLFKQYADRQIETINVQRDIQELADKLMHLRGNHKQLSANMHGELEQIDNRLKQIENQINRMLGRLENRREGD